MANIVYPSQNSNPRALIEEGIRRGVAWVGRHSPLFGSLAAESLFRTPTRHARPDWEAGVLADAEAFSVAYAGRELPAWKWGDGPTILLVHGWEGRGSQLGNFVGPLVSSGHRVVTFDLPGHGDAYDARMSVIDFARVIEEVHPAFGPIRGVIAHSMGAAASTLAYASSPFTDRMVLIAAPRSPRRFFDEFVRHFGLDDETTRATEDRYQARYGISLDEIDSRRSAVLVQAPVLVIHDRDDREIPFEHGELLAKSLPHGELLETRGLGHRRILKDARVIRAAAEFVASPLAVSVTARLDRELFDPELRLSA